MSADWYCEIDGQQYGPVTAIRLKQLATVGKLGRDDPVWREGMQKTRPASSIKGLFDDVRQPAAPPSRKGGELIELEVLETIEEVEEEPRKPARKKPTVKTFAEVEVTYREGFSQLDGPMTGTLFVQSDGLAFRYESEEGDEEIFLDHDVIEEILEPSKGDFPEAMKRGALTSKIGGQAGRLASGLIGNLIGGDVGNMVGGAGKTVSKMAEEGGNLGKPPRNRLVLYAHLRKKRRKVVFDTLGKSRDEMNEDARVLYKKILESRPEPEPEEEEAPIELEVMEDDPEPEPEPAPEPQPQRAVARVETGTGAAAGASAGAGAGKPGTSFRVLSGGRLKGPYPLRDLPGKIASGEVGERDLIGIETWVPAITFLAMGLNTGGAASPAPGAPAAGGGAKPRPEEAKKPAAAPAKPPDDGVIPVDDEFNL